MLVEEGVGEGDGGDGGELEAVAEVAGGDPEVGVAWESAEVREAVGGLGAEAGPGAFELGAGEGRDDLDREGEEFGDGGGGGPLVEAHGLLSGTDEDASIPPGNDVAGADVDDAGEGERELVEEQHLPFERADGGSGSRRAIGGREEAGGPGTGGEEDVVGFEVALGSAEADWV